MPENPGPTVFDTESTPARAGQFVTWHHQLVKLCAQLKWNRNKTETNQYQNSLETVLFQPKQPQDVLTVLANHIRYPLFMQNCCLCLMMSIEI